MTLAYPEATSVCCSLGSTNRSNVAVFCQSCGELYFKQPGVFELSVEAYVNGQYIETLCFDIDVTLTMTSAGNGSIIRSTHSTSAKKLGSIPSGKSGV